MPKRKSDDKLISIVVPTFEEEDNVAVLYEAIAKAMVDERYELIFIDDGSSDGTLQRLKKLSQHKGVYYVSFSRNFGHQAALRAGLEHARGDCVISMDADLQHPPELLPILIDKWREGYEVVYTVRDDSQTQVGLFKKLSSSMFYWLMNRLSGLNIDQGAADFRLLDRKVIDVIRSLPEPQLFMRGFISWCGFRQAPISYVPANRRSGQSKYSLKKMIQLGMQGITSFSIKPLRLASVLGFMSAGFGALYGLFAVLQYFLGNSTISGWTSVIIAVLIMGGAQLLILGIIGEYLGRTFIQTKQRPDYITREDNLNG